MDYRPNFERFGRFEAHFAQFRVRFILNLAASSGPKWPPSALTGPLLSNIGRKCSRFCLKCTNISSQDTPYMYSHDSRFTRMAHFSSHRLQVQKNDSKFGGPQSKFRLYFCLNCTLNSNLDHFRP